VDVIKLLLEHGADIGTILHVAAYRGHDHIITLLHQFNADLDSLGSFGKTPLWIAIEEGRDRTAKLLCTLGADPNVPNDEGHPALFIALELEEADLVKCLLGTHTDAQTHTMTLGQTQARIGTNQNQTKRTHTHPHRSQGRPQSEGKKRRRIHSPGDDTSGREAGHGPATASKRRQVASQAVWIGKFDGRV
jgi:ankyrin repeat protein